MRFDSIQLPAFGPFTDFSLSFQKSEHDLHLIYGPNEAGKSSLLRGIGHLFFGFPKSTGDNHLHANIKLLVGGGISHQGEELSFFRKKGNKNTLLDASLNTLPEDVLAPFLGSVNEEFFTNMFGLDSEGLRSGAVDLLSGKGDLGAILFSASLGGSPIDAAIKKLEAEANLLFKGAARKDTTILPALATMREARSAAREATLQAKDWTALQAEIHSAEEAFTKVQERFREHRQRSQFVETCVGALPVIDAIEKLEAELLEIKLPELPGDFTSRVSALNAGMSKNQQAYQQQEVQLKETRFALAEIPEYQVTLQAKNEIKTLTRKAEAHFNHCQELPALERRLSQVSPEDLHFVEPRDQVLLEDCAETLVALKTKRAELLKRQRELEEALASNREELTEGEDLGLLEEQAQRADALALELKGRLKLEETLEAQQKEELVLRQHLGVEGDPAEVRPPSVKMIQEALRESERVKEEGRETKRRFLENRDRLTEERASLSQLTANAPLFTPQDLREVREARDQLLAEIRQSGTFDDRLETLIIKADHIADTLRDEADQMVVAAKHREEIALLEARHENFEHDLEEASQALLNWLEEWKKVSPQRNPTAMLEWREDWGKLTDLAAARSQTERDLRALAGRERQFCDEMRGPDFSAIHRELKQALKKATLEQGRQETLRKQVVKQELLKVQLVREEEEAAHEVKAAEQEWRGLCEKVKLDPDLPSTVALELLTQRAEDHKLQLEVASRREAIGAYQKLLNAVAERLAAPPEAALLEARLDEAKLHQDRHQVLQTRLAELEKTFPEAELRFLADERELKDLREKAGTDDLDGVVRKIESRASLQARLEEQGELLKNFASGESLPSFLERVQKENRANLAEERLRLEDEGELIQEHRDEVRALLDEALRRRKKAMEAEDTVAVQRQKEADSLASIVADTERFRKLQAAIHFLKKQVEDYRQKTQGPMMQATSTFFCALTGNAFEKVSAQLNEKGTPELVAVRSNGELVRTSGLSEGTADQLYLALRLAAIERHLENHTPIPLILDDLLMTFDDDRARALLPVLREFSKKTQVLIFTHHAHLIDLVGPEVTVHRLAQ